MIYLSSSFSCRCGSFLKIIETIQSWLPALALVFLASCHQASSQETEEDGDAVVEEDSQEEASLEEVPQQQDSSTETAKTSQKEVAFSLPEGLEWQTQDQDPVYGDTKAQRGGTFRGAISSFPLSFRRRGVHRSDAVDQLSLVKRHPNTGNLLPQLATHWAFDEENATAYYRLNPQARWSDGEPLLAEDFVFSYEQATSKFIRDDYAVLRVRHITRGIQAHGDHIISVTLQKRHPLSLLQSYTNWEPAPKHFHKMDLSWTKKYDDLIEPTVAPYQITDYKKGEYLIKTRVENWWGDDLKYNSHLYNFQSLHYRVVRSFQERWELFMARELDTFSLPQKLWHEWTTGDPFKKGYIQKVTAYVEKIGGPTVFYLNLSREHWKDKRVRHAFAHSLNVERVIETVMRGDVERAHSTFPGYEDYTHHDLRARPYDPIQVKELMEQAGWDLSEEGLWQKDGKTFSTTLVFGDERDEPHMKIFQEYARKAGFDLKLKKLNHYEYYDALMNKKHDVAWSSLDGDGYHFPMAYHDAFHSSFAAKALTHNFSNVADDSLDEMILAYDRTYDEQKKAALSLQIQAKIHQIGAVIPVYTRNYERQIKWRYIQFPDTPGTRYGGLSLSRAWWDQEAYDELEEYQEGGKGFSVEDVVDTTYRRVYAPLP